MNLFISQPMRDRTDEEIKSERKRIFDKVQSCYDEDVYVIQSFVPGVTNEVSPVKLLGMEISQMSNADLVYFAKGWREHRGCNIEHAVAVSYGLKTYSE